MANFSASLAIWYGVRTLGGAETSSLANLTPSQIGIISAIADLVVLVSKPIKSTSSIGVGSFDSDLNLRSLIVDNRTASPTAHAAKEWSNASQGKNIPNFLSYSETWRVPIEAALRRSSIRRVSALPKPTKITFFILPPSRKILFERLSNRDMKDKLIVEERMQQFERDVLHWINYDYVVVNDDLNYCYSKIKKLIDAEVNNGSKDYDPDYIRNHIEKLTS